MKKIDREIKTLMEMAASGSLPGYPAGGENGSFFSESPASLGMEEHFSGENGALERRLEALWKTDPQLKQCIPLVIAAVEKSRSRESNAVAPAELYNYTM